MFIVIEIQKTNKIATLVYSYEDRNAAESKYYTILSAAAISKVPVHSATLLTDTGKELMHASYEHEEVSNE